MTVEKIKIVKETEKEVIEDVTLKFESGSKKVYRCRLLDVKFTGYGMLEYYQPLEDEECLLVNNVTEGFAETGYIGEYIYYMNQGIRKYHEHLAR